MSADSRRPIRDPEARDRRILDVIAMLAPGEVTTYGDVAAVAGAPGRARLVGRLLAITDEELPWWRVVTATGRLVPGHERDQAALLRAEGVQVTAGRVRSAPLGRFARRRDPSIPDQSSPGED